MILLITSTLYLYLLHIFLIIPAENSGVLLQTLCRSQAFRLCNIEKLTQFSWSKTSILEALKKYKIKKKIYMKNLKKGGKNGNIH